MVPALACIKWFDCHLPGAVVSQGTSRPNAENCSGFPPPTRQSASIEAELLGLTSIYSELCLHILSGERLESIKFSLHVQRQNNLLAVEIRKCTTPYCPSNSPGNTYMGLDLSPIGGGIAFPLRHGLRGVSSTSRVYYLADFLNRVYSDCMCKTGNGGQTFEHSIPKFSKVAKIDIL